MAQDVTNIDDLLSGQSQTSTQPTAPESQYDGLEYNEPEQAEEQYDLEEPEEPEAPDEEPSEAKTEVEKDDYGNEKTPEKTYTQQELNEQINRAVRERLARGNIAKAPEDSAPKTNKDFEYNPEADGDWQQQLEKFVEQTVTKMTSRKVQQQQDEQEQVAHEEFQTNFRQGMDRFNDFRDVVGAQPVTDAMTHALRGMGDPAAFIYAASKRQPAELSRISQIRDPYAQIVEMGKLEERMRKSSGGTQAPRPVSRTMEDSTMKAKEKSKEPSIEDLISRADKKRQAMYNQKRGVR